TRVQDQGSSPPLVAGPPPYGEARRCCGLTTMPFRGTTNGAERGRGQRCRDAGEVGELPRGQPLTERAREGSYVTLLSGHDLPFGVGVHERTFRVNVRWVTPLGEETASMS